jgi:hypothetical protein
VHDAQPPGCAWNGGKQAKEVAAGRTSVADVFEIEAQHTTVQVGRGAEPLGSQKHTSYLGLNQEVMGAGKSH